MPIKSFASLSKSYQLDEGVRIGYEASENSPLDDYLLLTETMLSIHCEELHILRPLDFIIGVERTTHLEQIELPRKSTFIDYAQCDPQRDLSYIFYKRYIIMGSCMTETEDSTDFVFEGGLQAKGLLVATDTTYNKIVQDASDLCGWGNTRKLFFGIINNYCNRKVSSNA